MLVCENRRRHEHRSLQTVRHALEQCPRSDLRLAEAHITAEQAIHGKRFFHVLFDLFDCPQLISGLLVRKCLFKFLLPDGVLAEAVPRLHAPRRIQVDQVLRHDRDRCLRLGLGRFPFPAGQLIDARRAAVRTDIFLRDIHLLHRHIQHIVACIFDLDIVLLFALHRKLLDADELADAVILVVDGLVGLTDTDERIVKMLRAAGKPVTLAVNKVDDRESEYLTAEFWKMGLGEPYGISAMHGRGIGELLDAALDSLKKAERTSGFLTPSHLRRVALVGRPNVGKSSLLNQLAHEERTVVNDLAGTTRDPVDEVVTVDGEDWLFIDTAGIKRRLHKLSGAEYFSSLRTQAAIERSELALVLFDASQPISDQDLKVMSQAVDAGRCIVLVFNKWDLMDEFDRQRMERLWKTEFNRVTWAQRVNLSAKTGWHTNRLANAMRGALASWDKRIPTGKLNAFLGKIQAAHPHPLRGGKQPRILFATQASTRPPRFVIFATGFLEHGYRRYIERCLREEFGFEGSPIQISVNVREKKKRK